MRGILQIYKSFFGKLTAFLVFSFFVSGCHTVEEPVPVSLVTVKKETASPSQSKGIQTDAIVKIRKKKPETPVTHSASGILLPEKKADKNRIYDSTPDDKHPDAAVQRDPFALPEALRKQQHVTQGKKSFASGKNRFEESLKRTDVQQQPAASPATGLQEPCVAGVFDNGKEKLALLHWQRIQGTFRRGESLGNGYYVREITAAAVLLYPEKSGSGMKPVMLTLQQ